ncbi:MAG: prepilin-type N-terminal cleavage/methylation domain-containing protein [Symploca sp. SIO2E9]|nr:prepilin-type N-terminal cleavage/methylation domain-containing protein [Symploca sp. SIO2E9]
MTSADSKREISQNEAGFTLIELIVVIIIISVLSAIAAPGWLAFTNQRRVNAANDEILNALQRAQSDAKRRKLSYSVSFRTDDRVPQVATYLAKDNNGNDVTPDDLDPNTWKTLGNDFELKPGQVLLGTSINGENISSDTFEYASGNEQTITFDFNGNLPLKDASNFSENGLIIAVAVPDTSENQQPIESTRRCVKVQTLLGAMQIGKGDECDTDN